MKTKQIETGASNLFRHGLADELGVSVMVADAQWSGYSRQLSDREREEIESGGWVAGKRIAVEIKSL